MEEPKVSIIAGCYNHSKYVERLLNSVLSQTYKNIQLIVFDDFSSDDSAQIIEKWITDNNISCKFIKHTENKGLAYSLNEALRFSEGKYLQLISCDDILINEKIEIQVNQFENLLSEEYGCVASDFSTIDGNDNIIKDHYFSKNFIFPKKPLSSLLTNSLGYGIIIHSPTILFKKSILDKIGYYNENIMQEDLDFLVRVCLNFKVGFCKQSLVKYRILNTSMSNNIKTIDRLYFERLKVIQNYETILVRQYTHDFYRHQLNYIYLLLKNRSFDKLMEEKLSLFIRSIKKEQLYAGELDNILIRTQKFNRLLELNENKYFSNSMSCRYLITKKALFSFTSILEVLNKGIRKVIRIIGR